MLKNSNYNSSSSRYSHCECNEYSDYQKNDKKNIYIYLILLTICAIILLVYISYTLQINNLSYQIDNVQNQIKVAEEKNHKLDIKLSNARSLSQVDKLARSELNMVEPISMQTLVLKAENIELAGEVKESYFLSDITNFITNLGTARAYSPE
ncbi:MAG: cell division protein FtsL [Halanaerobiales bacterium]|nr:cell division protein FtsL [Halanaerobiales bacterium]